jgi:hypothetical protein
VDSDSHPNGWDPLPSRYPFAEPGDFPVNGQGGADCSLGGVFQCYRGAEQGHAAVPGRFVDRPPVIVYLVDEDLVHLIHKGVDPLRTELFGKRREPNHVAEENGDLSLLALNPIPLGKDLFGEAFR